MSDIKNNISSILNNIPENVSLVAVSKTKPNEMIMEAYEEGQRIFGENKVQEMVLKFDSLPKDILWHMIGHLQTNKVKFIAPFVSLIHSVDSLKLLKEINKEGLKSRRIINCLLQVKIANEDTKYGLSKVELEEISGSSEYKSFNNVRIKGLMGMATYTEDEQQIREEFKRLNKYFLDLKARFFEDDDYFSEISMGMSGDYQFAIEEGATIIRVGSEIFGTRYYS